MPPFPFLRIGCPERGSEGASRRTPPLPGKESVCVLPDSLPLPGSLFAQSARRSVASVASQVAYESLATVPGGRDRGSNAPRSCFTASPRSPLSGNGQPSRHGRTNLNSLHPLGDPNHCTGDRCKLGDSGGRPWSFANIDNGRFAKEVTPCI